MSAHVCRKFIWNCWETNNAKSITGCHKDGPLRTRNTLDELLSKYRPRNHSIRFLTHREEHGQYDDEIEQLGGNIYHVPHLNPLNPGYYKALDDFSGHSHIILCILIWIVRVHFRSVQLKANVPNRIAHIHNTNQDRDIKYPIKMISKKLMPYYATDFLHVEKRLVSGHSQGENLL